MRRSTVRRLVVASGRPPGRTSATSRWTVFEPMSRTPRRTGRGYRRRGVAGRRAAASVTRYDERDDRRTRAPRLAGTLALPRDRPRRVVASRGRDRASRSPRPRSCRSAASATGSTWPRSPRSTCRCRGCCRCTPRPTKRLGADTSTFLARARLDDAVRRRRRRIGRRRQVDDRAPAARAHEPLAGHAARRAGDDRRIPLPERRARAARADEPQGLPRVVRPARARLVPHRGQERRARGARAVLLAHAVRHRARRARDGAPARRRDRRGTQRAAAAAAPERRRGERAVRLLDLRRRRQRPHHAVVRRPVPGAAARGVQQPELVLQRLRRTSPTRRRSSGRSASGTTSTSRTSRRTCCRPSTARRSCSRRPPTTRSSGCCCASSDADPVDLVCSGSSHNPPPTIEGMCGIVGYVGPRQSQAILLAGLSRLEYRGYDSAGIAVIDADGDLGMRKRAGKLGVLRDDLKDVAARRRHHRHRPHPLGDARRTDRRQRPPAPRRRRQARRHPQRHHRELLRDQGRARLARATPSAARPTPRSPRSCSAASTARTAATSPPRSARSSQRLDGAFTLLAMHEDQPGTRRRRPPQLAARDRPRRGRELPRAPTSPRSSSTPAARSRSARTRSSRSRPTASRSPTSPATRSRSSRSRCCGMPRPPTRADGRRSWRRRCRKSPRPSPTRCAAASATAQVVIPELDGLDELFAGINRIIIIACGTAAYAGMVGKYALEQWTRVPVDVELAHEFRYRDPVIGPDTLVVSISQSGETMDTLMAVKYARERGAKTLSICNTQGATIPRESDAIVYTHAGPEVAVASTKAFVAQITALYLLGAARRPRPRRRSARPRPRSRCSSSSRSPTRSRGSSSASRRASSSSRTGWPTPARCCSSAATSATRSRSRARSSSRRSRYIHAEGFAAGELKHGPIALIEPGQPVFVIVPSPRESALLHTKVVSNIQEIRARGARVIAIAEEGDAAVLPVRRRGAAHPARRSALRAAAGRRAAAHLRDGPRDGEGPRRRPAPQPREVRHGRVAASARSSAPLVRRTAPSIARWADRADGRPR